MSEPHELAVGNDSPHSHRPLGAGPANDGEPADDTGPAERGESTRIRVFVSYAHDCDEHRRWVLALATFLVGRGLDVRLDTWAEATRRDWSSWITEELTGADFVVVVASPDYRRAGDGQGSADLNRGVQSEAAALRDLLYRDRTTWVPRLIPVIPPGRSLDDVPLFLQPYTASHYPVAELTDAGAETLLRVLTRQPAHLRPPLGTVPLLPPLPPPR